MSRHNYGMGVALVWIALVMVVCISWVKNVYELSQCDFEAPYKCEILHGIGIPVAPLSVVFAWVDFEQ